MDSRITRVVIADDEPLALNGMAGIVEYMPGFEVAGKATNGAQALDIIQQQDVDLVLTDIKMPGTDGMWLIERIDALGLMVTVIMVSAYDDQKYIRAAIRNPYVYDYVFKPFMPQEIRELLEAASRHHHRRKAEMPGSEINMNLLINSIMQNNAEVIEGDLDIFYARSNASLAQLKNLAYGWVMFIYNNILASQPSGSLNESDIMNAIYSCQSKSEIRQVFMSFVRHCCQKYVRDDEVTTLVNGALQIIHKELDNPDLNLNYVAGKLDVTPNYLSGRFSRDMKQNFSNYLTHLRINTAKELLASINRKVYEVSLDVGFADVSYFNKVFKEHTGLTPLQYRQQVMSSGALPVHEESNALSSAESDELRNALLASSRRYPYQQPQDAVLLVYQNEFGPQGNETLMELKQEYESVAHGYGSGYEDLGNGLVRVNLNNLDTGEYSLEKLHEDCRQTAEEIKGNRERYLAKLEVLKEMTREGMMPFNEARLSEYLEEHDSDEMPQPSEVMTDFYHPSYRVVLKKLVPFLS